MCYFYFRYTLAENLDTQLRQMSEDLKEVIECLNETNRSQDSNDPVSNVSILVKQRSVTGGTTSTKGPKLVQNK